MGLLPVRADRDAALAQVQLQKLLAGAVAFAPDTVHFLGGFHGVGTLCFNKEGKGRGNNLRKQLIIDSVRQIAE